MRLVSTAFPAIALSVGAFASPTFTEDFADIVFNNCAGCHREGQGAPFTLTSCADAAKRGQLIAAVTQLLYMPPWHAASADVRFQG